MMDADTELRLLEDEFPKSSKVWATDTDAALDQRILSIADRAAPYLAQQHMRKEQNRISEIRGEGLLPPKFRPGRGSPPGRFNPIANSEVTPPSYKSMKNVSMSAPPPKRPDRPAGADKILASLKGAEQQAWLDRIAAVVKAGDIELASYLLRRYRVVFRDK